MLLSLMNEEAIEILKYVLEQGLTTSIAGGGIVVFIYLSLKYVPVLIQSVTLMSESLKNISEDLDSIKENTRMMAGVENKVDKALEELLAIKQIVQKNHIFLSK